ncbi:hypothetical protein SAMN05216597_5974 [Pseudomonas cannabina]|nr:hypothetical protein SAMN05216597_5974 [Pseudomonas cannabina]
MTEISAVPAYNPKNGRFAAAGCPVHTVNFVRLMNVKILGRLCGAGKVIPFYTFQIPAIFNAFAKVSGCAVIPVSAKNTSANSAWLE